MVGHTKLERMDDFFAKRVDDYDGHMLGGVEGCAEAYRLIPLLLPNDTADLLDLGCGTGLELGYIFGRFPQLRATGVDISEAMTACLRRKFPDKPLKLINGSYLGRNFGSMCFDAAVSCETMHHMSHVEKLSVYSAIRFALRTSGRYIECDYVAPSQADEDARYAENARLRREQNIPAGEFYHYDTPCTVNNQIDLLMRAGFRSAEKVWQAGNTAVIAAFR